MIENGEITMTAQNHEKYLAASKKINKINICSTDNDITLKVYYMKYLDYDVETKKRKINSKTHSHKFYELLLLVDGENTYCIDGEYVKVGKGEFILITPGTPHSYVNGSREFIKIALCFDIEIAQTSGLYRRFTSLKSRKSVVGRGNDVIMSLMDFIFGSMDAASDVSGKLMRWSILFVLTLILEQNTEPVTEQEESPEKKARDSDEIFYDKAVEYIQNHLSEPSLVSKMAADMYISERQIRRRLQLFCGKSAGVLIDEIKCERARQLLLAQADTQEICQVLGFNDYHSFIRFFKRMDGQTPKEFKLAMLKDNYT